MFDQAFINGLADQLAATLLPKLAESGDRAKVLPRLFSVKDAARYIGRSENALRILIHRKEVPAIHGGSRVHLDRRDLDHWIDKNKF